MINDSLVWAAVPHNNDGVVFQIRLEYGLQRFYLSRGVLEQVFELERRASDSRQLEVFYIYLNRIIAMASAKRSIASADHPGTSDRLAVTDAVDVQRSGDRFGRFVRRVRGHRDVYGHFARGRHRDYFRRVSLHVDGDCDLQYDRQ